VTGIFISSISSISKNLLLSMYLINHEVMKTFRDVDVQPHDFLTLAVGEGVFLM
jgi:hypothetical protein